MSLFRKSVDEVLAVFHKAVEELKKAEDYATAKAVDIRQDIYDLEEDVAFHIDEAKRAKGARAKIEALLDI